MPGVGLAPGVAPGRVPSRFRCENGCCCRLWGWPRTQAQIAWSPKQHHLAIAEYGSIKVFDATTGRTLRQYGTHDQRNTALAWHPDGKTIYTGGEDRLIHVWQAPR